MPTQDTTTSPSGLEVSFFRSLKFHFHPTKCSGASPTPQMTGNVVRSYPTPTREPIPID